MDRETKNQVEIIRQAFAYVDQFKGKTFVIYLSSGLIQSAYLPMIIADLSLLHKSGVNIVIVPGSSSQTNQILDKFNIPTEYYNGIRITTKDAIPFVKMGAFDVANKVMSQLSECGINAVIGNWVKARGIGVRDGIDYHCAGIVDTLNTEALHNVMEDKFIPIFPNIGWSVSGKPYNISSRDLAKSLSIHLQTSKLFLVTEQNGISPEGLNLPDNQKKTSTIFHQLTLGEAEEILHLNNHILPETDLELLSIARQACTHGVERVHVVNGTDEGVILKEVFSNRGNGSMIYTDEYENIRPMQPNDIHFVMSIIDKLVQQAILASRTAEDIIKQIDDYIVYEIDKIIHGCGALHIYDDIGEIAAIAVDHTYTKGGTGKKIVTFLLDRAKKLKLKKVVILTTQTSDWFTQFGFKEGQRSDLPPKKLKAYNENRNSRVLVYIIENS